MLLLVLVRNLVLLLGHEPWSIEAMQTDSLSLLKDAIFGSPEMVVS